MKAFANFNVQTAKNSLSNLRIYQNSIEDSFGDIITLFPHLVKEDLSKTSRTIYVIFLSQSGIYKTQFAKMLFFKYFDQV